jgi:U3 small nucleolar RNA-associated protein 18
MLFVNSNLTSKFCLGRSEESLETFSLSPDGKYITFLGKDGYIILVSRRSKQWIANLKMNGTVRSLCYSPDNQLYSLGGNMGFFHF